MDDTPFPTLSFDAMPALLRDEPAALVMAAPVMGISGTWADASAVLATGAAAPALCDALALVVELAPQVINNLAGRALLSLDRQSTASKDDQQRALLDASAMELEKQRSRWVQQYPALLRIACAHPNANALAATIAHADVRICAAELQQLDQLAQELGGKRNPLAAVCHVQAIGDLVARTQAHPALRQVWLDQLLSALGTQLAWVSLQLLAALRTPGNREASPLAEEPGFKEFAAVAFGLDAAPLDSSSTPASQAAFTPEMRHLAAEARRTVGRLRKALGEPDTQPGDLDASKLSEMDRMLRDLDEAERMMALLHAQGLKLPDTDPEDTVAATTFAEKNASKSAAAQSAAQVVDYIEPIKELIKNYQNTTSPSLAHVLHPLREALQLLVAPLNKLAQLDADFLADGNHAVRLLLGSITQRSLGFSTEMAEGFTAFMGPVNKVVMALCAAPQPSARMFAQAHSSLQALWQRQDAEIKQVQERKAQEQSMVESRKQLASRLAFELVSRRDAGDAPVQIKQLLMGAWAQVLARAQLYPQHPQDHARYAQVTAALLWSVSNRRAGVRKSQLEALLPELLACLEEGLASVEQHPSQIEAIMKDMAKLHADVLASDVPADQGTQGADHAPVITPRAQSKI